MGILEVQSGGGGGGVRMSLKKHLMRYNCFLNGLRFTINHNFKKQK